MGFDYDEYRENSRIISYVKPDVKAKAQKAVEDGVATSVSKLTSDIIEDNIDSHISKLKDEL
jgi:hypothetical protein